VLFHLETPAQYTASETHVIHTVCQFHCFIYRYKKEESNYEKRPACKMSNLIVEETAPRSQYSLPIPKQPRHSSRRYLDREDFLDLHMDELISTHSALKEYLADSAFPLLQELDFESFCDVAFTYSNIIKR
jgi:hypothetical protein